MPEHPRYIPLEAPPDVIGVELPPLPNLSHEDIRNGSWALLADIELIVEERLPYFSDEERRQVWRDVAEVYDFLSQRVQGDLAGVHGFSFGEHLPSGFFPALMRLMRRFHQVDAAVREDPHEREGEDVMNNGHYNLFYLAFRRALDNIAKGQRISKAEQERFTLLQELPEHARETEPRIDVQKPYPLDRDRLHPDHIRRGSALLVLRLEDEIEFLPTEVKQDAAYLIETLGKIADEKLDPRLEPHDIRTLHNLIQNPDTLHLDALPKRLYHAVLRLQVASPKLARAFLGHQPIHERRVIELTESGKRAPAPSNELSYNPINAAILATQKRMDEFKATMHERYRYEEMTDIPDSADLIAFADAAALARLDTLGRTEHAEGFLKKAWRVLTTDINELLRGRRTTIESRAIERMVDQWEGRLNSLEGAAVNAQVVRDIHEKTKELAWEGKYPIDDWLFSRLVQELNESYRSDDERVPQLEEAILELFKYLAGLEYFPPRQRERAQKGLLEKIGGEQERIVKLRERAEGYYALPSEKFLTAMAPHGIRTQSVDTHAKQAWANMMIALKRAGEDVDLKELIQRFPQFSGGNVKVSGSDRGAFEAWGTLAEEIVRGGGVPLDIGLRDWEHVEQNISNLLPAAGGDARLAITFLKIQRARVEQGDMPDGGFMKEMLGALDREVRSESLQAIRRETNDSRRTGDHPAFSHIREAQELLRDMWAELARQGSARVMYGEMEINLEEEEIKIETANGFALHIDTGTHTSKFFFDPSSMWEFEDAINMTRGAILEQARKGDDAVIQFIETQLERVKGWDREGFRESTKRTLEDLLAQLYIDRLQKSPPTMGTDLVRHTRHMHEVLDQRYDLRAKLAVEAVAASVPLLTHPKNERGGIELNELAFYEQVLKQMYPRSSAYMDESFQDIQIDYLFGREEQKQEQPTIDVAEKIMSNEPRVQAFPALFTEMIRRFPEFRLSPQADEMIIKLYEKYRDKPEVIKGYGEYLLLLAERDKKGVKGVKMADWVDEAILFALKKLYFSPEDLTALAKGAEQDTPEGHRWTGMKYEIIARIHAARIHNGFKDIEPFPIGFNTEPSVKDNPQLADALCLSISLIEKAQIEEGVKHEPSWTYYDRAFSDYAESFGSAPAKAAGELAGAVVSGTKKRIERLRAVALKAARK